jgi:hypothetical protein
MFMNHEGCVIVRDWAAGFMLAVGKSTDAWTKILLTDMRKVLAPILVSHDLGARLLPEVSNERNKIRAVAHHHIADAVISVREVCAPQRAAVAQGPGGCHKSRRTKRADRSRRSYV